MRRETPARDGRREREDFRRLTIAHPLLVAADARLKRTVRDASEGGIVALVSPTGVGKTTLKLRVEKWLTEASLAELAADPGRLAVAGVEALVEGRPAFAWKDYYRRALLALEEPLVDFKLPTPGQEGGTVPRTARPPASAVPDLRFALEQALRHRRPKAFFVDEAQHLSKIASGRKLLDQIDCVKSLANVTGVVHVLVGTYGLMDLMNLSGQLARRTSIVHLRRYRAEDAEDVEAFTNAVFTFAQHLPFEEPPELAEHWEYLYERSIGCVGVLKDWLVRALEEAFESRAHTMTREHLEQTALPVSQCVNMAREARDGESRFADDPAGAEALRALVGLGAARRSVPAEDRRPSRRRRAVGERAPARDPVGGSDAR